MINGTVNADKSGTVDIDVVITVNEAPSFWSLWRGPV
jgi:hypothetical protein